MLWLLRLWSPILHATRPVVYRIVLIRKPFTCGYGILYVLGGRQNQMRFSEGATPVRGKSQKQVHVLTGQPSSLGS